MVLSTHQIWPERASRRTLVSSRTGGSYISQTASCRPGPRRPILQLRAWRRARECLQPVGLQALRRKAEVLLDPEIFAAREEVRHCLAAIAPILLRTIAGLLAVGAVAPELDELR